MENIANLLCIGLITVLFVLPMWAYINVTERRARIARDKAVEAGRHEPVTIQPYVDLSVCMGSGACVPACPEDVLKVLDGQAIAVNMSACIGHGACVPACPVGAIELVFGSEKRGIDIPRVGPDFQTNVPGVYIAGELGGMGLIASAAEQGVKAMGNALAGVTSREGLSDVVIVGAGPAGIAAAAVAKQKGAKFVLVDQEQVGGAVRHYPRKKLVFTRPMDIPGYGKVNLRTLLKEDLVALFEKIVAKLALPVDTFERVDKVKARPDGGFDVVTDKRTLPTQRVILALGRRGTPRKLDVEGEEQEKVAYSLLEPEHYQYDHLLIVGGGDSAVEAALQLSEQPGNTVTLSYRGDKINRPKDKNIKLLKDAVKGKRVSLMLESNVKEIAADRVVIDHKGDTNVLPNDYVFVMVGGVLPTKFLQDVGIKIQKHFGKRVQELEDEPAPKGDTAPQSLPLDLSFLNRAGSDEQTMALPMKGNDEPTVSLPADEVAAMVAALEAEPSRPAPEPAPAPPSSGPRSAVVRPPPPTGLQRLDTHSVPDTGRRALVEPASPPPAAPAPAGLPVAFGDGPPPGYKREVTEIKPLKRVPADGGPPSAAVPDADESTVPREPAAAPPAPASNDPFTAGDLGRVVARRDEEPPRPAPAAAPPPKAPISPISARLSRRGATRSPLSTAAPESERAPAPPSSPAAAAQRALDEGSIDDALRLSRELADGTPAEARWGRLVEGQAHLERGDWAAAIPPLRAAADAARSEGEGEALGRALSSLGRALHHAGQFDECRAVLVEATRVWSPPPLDAAAILRLLGDLALRMGDVETAEERWTEAAQIARDQGSPDAEARACRGLASCTTVRGHYAEALDQLNEALQLLDETADPRVVTALLARRLELESVLGRYARALESGERLLEITSDDPSGRAEALGLLAEVLSALGLADETIQAAGEVGALIEAIGPRPDPAIRAARALCEVGRPAEALAILDHLSSADRSPVDDLQSQIDAVRARALARSDSTAARDLANDVLTRPSPLLAIRAARIRLDAALALHDAGADSAARNAVKRGLKLVQGSGNKGLKLELLIAMYLAAPDHRVVEAAARTAMRVLEDLPPHAAQTFRARPVIAAALARYREA